MKTLIFIFGILIVPLAVRAVAGVPEKYIYADLVEVKQFSIVTVDLKGSADKIGINKNALTDFVRMRFANLFGGIPIKGFPTRDEIRAKPEIEREYGSLYVTVWTVGRGSAVAYYIELQIGCLSSRGLNYESAILGYTTENALNETKLIQDGITSLMESGATALLKAQGKI